uniref:Uncharacterized protein n=1 Tax=Oryza glumipatula TaxID=40148 RepID=A0A0E0BPZ0_9ORYZ
MVRDHNGRAAPSPVARGTTLHHAAALLGCGSEAVPHGRPARSPVPRNGIVAPPWSRILIVRRSVY